MDISAQEILNSMFNADEKVCIRVFEDRKDGLFNGAKYTVECGKYNTIEETLRNHNAMNRGIFFTVNYGGTATVKSRGSTPSSSRWTTSPSRSRRSGSRRFP